MKVDGKNLMTIKNKAYKKGKAFIIINSIMLIMLALIMLYPFINSLAISISSPDLVIKGEIAVFPRGINLDAYKMVFKSNDLWKAYKNSIIYTVLGTTFTLFVVALTAYPLSRKKLRGNRIYTLLIALTMFIPSGIIPFFLVAKELKMIDTIWIMVLPHAFTGFYILLMRSSYKNIPESLIESAHIDGASEWRILFQIMIPLSKATFAVVGLFCAIWHWNNFLGPLIFLNNPDKFPLTILLRRILLQGGVSKEMGLAIADSSAAMREKGFDLIMTPGLFVSMKMAITMLSILPILFLYPFIQRFFSKGVMLGSIKE